MAERVIWERTVDQNKIRERSDRFRKRFFPAAGLILLIVLVVTGWQNAIGALFVVGLVGMVWGNMVRYQSLSDAANPVMTVTDGRLKLGDRTVIIEDVKRFTTIATSLQTSLFGRHSRIHLGQGDLSHGHAGFTRWTRSRRVRLAEHDRRRSCHRSLGARGRARWQMGGTGRHGRRRRSAKTDPAATAPRQPPRVEAVARRADQAGQLGSPSTTTPSFTAGSPASFNTSNGTS